MMTREEILAVDQYCKEHNVSLNKYFEEYPKKQKWEYFRYKKRYRMEDEAGLTPAGFVQLSEGGPFVSSTMSPSKTFGKSKQAKSVDAESFMTIELRTVSGTAMRIQGNMSAAHLREIISASNV